jgi:hypothetical protein
MLFGTTREDRRPCDQHGDLPEIPPCDLLIIADDVCSDRFGPFLAMHDPDQQKAWFDRQGHRLEAPRSRANIHAVTDSRR